MAASLFLIAQLPKRLLLKLLPRPCREAKKEKKVVAAAKVETEAENAVKAEPEVAIVAAVEEIATVQEPEPIEVEVVPEVPVLLKNLFQLLKR